MSKATIVSKSIKGNEREAKLELRGGEKGTGRVLHTVRYWPWSGKSVDAAYNMIYNVAEREGVEVVPSPDREDW